MIERHRKADQIVTGRRVDVCRRASLLTLLLISHFAFNRFARCGFSDTEGRPLLPNRCD